MVKLADTDFATVTYNADLFLATVIWKPHPLSFDDYKLAFNVILDYQEKEGVKFYNFMSDIRQQSVIPPDYRKWFQSSAVPRAVKQGLKRGAVVTDAGIFKRYYLNHIMNTTKRFGFPLKLFKTHDVAYRWFKSCLVDDNKS